MHPPAEPPRRPLVHDARRRDTPPPEAEAAAGSTAALWIALGMGCGALLIGAFVAFAAVLAGTWYAADCLADGACTFAFRRHTRDYTAGFEGPSALLMGAMMAAIALFFARVIASLIAGAWHGRRTGDRDAEPPPMMVWAFTAAVLAIVGGGARLLAS